MYSITIASTILFAIFSSTLALECRPVLCTLACRNGFDVDAVGCPRCACRATPEVCVEPIFGYNCGSVDHRDCPSSHECQLHFSGLTGECCLRRTGSTTGRPQTSTGRPQTSTGRPQTSTGRPQTTTGRPQTSTGRPQTSTGRPQTSTGRPQTSTGRPFLINGFFAFSTQAGTTNHATGTQRPFTSGSGSTTQRWF